MSNEQTLQDKLTAATEATNNGIPVNWQQMCYETYNLMMAEITRLNEAAAPPEVSDET